MNYDAYDVSDSYLEDQQCDQVISPILDHLQRRKYAQLRCKFSPNSFKILIYLVAFTLVVSRSKLACFHKQ